jgi:predicted metal-dependent enzyme (double-stranded beta helix superfamily)
MTETYNLDTFSRDLDAIIEEHSKDLRAIVEKAKPALSRLLKDTSWLEPRYYEPRPNASVQYLLHKPLPARDYTITSVVFPQGYTTPIHDHATWGLVGLWRGEEEEERFERVDDGTRPHNVTLKVSDMLSSTPGTVNCLIPPDEEIHRIRTVSPGPSYSIHVYGGQIDGKSRRRFDLETGAVTLFQVKCVSLD